MLVKSKIIELFENEYLFELQTRSCMPTYVERIDKIYLDQELLCKQDSMDIEEPIRVTDAFIAQQTPVMVDDEFWVAVDMEIYLLCSNVQNLYKLQEFVLKKLYPGLETDIRQSIWNNIIPNKKITVNDVCKLE